MSEAARAERLCIQYHRACPILSYPILSYPILSYPILSYPILSHPILSYPIPSCTPQKRGKKALVLDPAVSGPLTLLDPALSSLLTEHGVAK